MASRERGQLVEQGMDHLHKLRNDFETAMKQGVQSGSLAAAKGIQTEIEEEMVEIKDRRLSFPFFRVMINYDLSIDDLVKMGQYDWSSPSLPNQVNEKSGILPA